MEKFRIKFPIGDWNSDDCNRYEWYEAESDKDVSAVKAAHLKIKAETGIDLHKIAATDGDFTIGRKDLELLSLLVRDPQEHTKEEDYEVLGMTFFYDDEDSYEIEPEQLISIWVFLLNFVDSGLNLQLLPIEFIPSPVYPGVEPEDKFIGVVGRGLVI